VLTCTGLLLHLQMVQQDFRLTDDYVARKGTLLMPSITAATMQVWIEQWHMWLLLLCMRKAALPPNNAVHIGTSPEARTVARSCMLRSAACTTYRCYWALSFEMYRAIRMHISLTRSVSTRNAKRTSPATSTS
jgi:hypothetical protein